MFYEKQPLNQQNEYKSMLSLIGSLSNLFADSETPMLYYRAHENVFCKYFEAENLSREDCSADASKGTIGIGLKTWVGRNDQKVAEFGKLRPTYEKLAGNDLINKIAEYRNERIRVTKNIHGLDQMIYHIVKRIPHGMQIYEATFDCIDIKNIKLDKSRGNENNTYFSDGKHTYHFSMSKNTLFMLFDDMELLDSFDVEILKDPYEALKNLLTNKNENLYPIINQNYVNTMSNKDNKLCLRLYSIKKGKKVVFSKSGLNQWNANGRKRNVNELYIRYPVEDRKRKIFFTPTNKSFNLFLPDGSKMSAKVCQASGKAIMSNPNSALGKWLLRDVFELEEGKIVTYDMLKIFGIDSVMFTKIDNDNYRIDFCPLGTYEAFYDLEDIDD